MQAKYNNLRDQNSDTAKQMLKNIAAIKENKQKHAQLVQSMQEQKNAMENNFNTLLAQQKNELTSQIHNIQQQVKQTNDEHKRINAQFTNSLQELESANEKNKKEMQQKIQDLTQANKQNMLKWQQHQKDKKLYRESLLKKFHDVNVKFSEQNKQNQEINLQLNNFATKLQDQKNSQQAEVEKLKKEYNALNLQNATQKKLANQILNKIDLTNKQIKNINEELANTNSKIDDVQKKSFAAIAKQENELKNAKNLIAQDLMQYKQESTMNKNTIASIREKLLEQGKYNKTQQNLLKSQLKMAMQKSDQYEEHIQQLQDKQNTLSSKIDKQYTTFEAMLQKQQQSSEDKEKLLQAELSNLHHTMQQDKQALAIKQQDLEKALLSSDKESAKQKLALEAEIRKLKSKVRKNDNKISQVNQKVDQEVASIKQMTTEKLNKLQEKNTEIMQSINSMNQDKERLEREFEIKHQQLLKAQGDVHTKLKQEIVIIKKNKTQLEKSIQDMKQVQDNLANKINSNFVEITNKIKANAKAIEKQHATMEQTRKDLVDHKSTYLKQISSISQKMQKQKMSQQEMQTLKKQMQMVAAKVKSSDEHLQKLSVAMQKNKEKLKNISAEDISNKMNMLHSAVENLQKSTAAQAKNHETLSSMYEKLEKLSLNKEEANQQTAKILKEKIQELEQAQLEHAKKFHAMEQDNQHILQQMAEQKDAANNNYFEKKLSIDELVGDLENQQQTNQRNKDKLTKQMLHLQKEMHSANGQKDNIQKHLQIVMENLRESDKRIRNTTNQLHVYKQEQINLKKEDNRLKLEANLIMQEQINQYTKKHIALERTKQGIEHRLQALGEDKDAASTLQQQLEQVKNSITLSHQYMQKLEKFKDQSSVEENNAKLKQDIIKLQQEVTQHIHHDTESINKLKQEEEAVDNKRKELCTQLSGMRDETQKESILIQISSCMHQLRNIRDRIVDYTADITLQNSKVINMDKDKIHAMREENIQLSFALLEKKRQLKQGNDELITKSIKQLEDKLGDNRNKISRVIEDESLQIDKQLTLVRQEQTSTLTKIKQLQADLQSLKKQSSNKINRIKVLSIEQELKHQKTLLASTRKKLSQYANFKKHFTQQTRELKAQEFDKVQKWYTEQESSVPTGTSPANLQMLFLHQMHQERNSTNKFSSRKTNLPLNVKKIKMKIRQDNLKIRTILSHNIEMQKRLLNQNLSNKDREYIIKHIEMQNKIARKHIALLKRKRKILMQKIKEGKQRQSKAKSLKESVTTQIATVNPVRISL